MSKHQGQHIYIYDEISIDINEFDLIIGIHHFYSKINKKIVQSQ